VNTYVVLGRARKHLFDIWEYTAKTRGLDAADKIRDRIEAAFAKLGDSPGMGHWREDLLNQRYKFWLVHPFLIAYRWDVKPIQIIAIVHGARKLEAFFKEPTE
jgi:plasmid stabilization system protein ParE